MIFWTKFAQKEYFTSNARQMNITIEFNIFELVSVLNFILNRQIWFFRPTLTKNCIFISKQDIWTSPSNSTYSNLGTKLHIKQVIMIFRVKFAKKFYFQSKTNEHNQRIQHIWISLGIKFHLNKTVLPFWNKFA